MGMGEPLHNMEAVVPSINILTHPLGLHLSNYKVGALVGSPPGGW